MVFVSKNTAKQWTELAKFSVTHCIAEFVDIMNRLCAVQQCDRQTDGQNCNSQPRFVSMCYCVFVPTLQCCADPPRHRVKKRRIYFHVDNEFVYVFKARIRRCPVLQCWRRRHERTSRGELILPINVVVDRMRWSAKLQSVHHLAGIPAELSV